MSFASANCLKCLQLSCKCPCLPPPPAFHKREERRAGGKVQAWGQQLGLWSQLCHSLCGKLLSLPVPQFPLLQSEDRVHVDVLLVLSSVTGHSEQPCTSAAGTLDRTRPVPRTHLQAWVPAQPGQPANSGEPVRAHRSEPPSSGVVRYVGAGGVGGGGKNRCLLP